MAINQNHPFEDIEGVKCAVVEKNVQPLRAAFLKDLLEFNGYTVMMAAAPAKVTPSGEEAGVVDTPANYTLGVTDVMFNSTNAVFGRLLRTREGKIVTLDYWYQRSTSADDSVPYFQLKK
jgi:hypothetical protein